ncbi:hypothetical protein G3I17_28635 [Streptomyces sp. SID13031]|nr:hypothetical protein [Streptomyces sp. SID13031]
MSNRRLLGWLRQLPAIERNRLLARVDLVAEYGPGLGWPVVETIKGSRHPNLKEIRSEPYPAHAC